jgi:carbonic anhydrase
MNNRGLLKGVQKVKYCILALLCILLVYCNINVYADSPEANEALQQLMAGNLRFQTLQVIHPNQDLTRRNALINLQHPIAIIVSCSDSRQPPELIFDQGLGDIFSIRTAGNTIGKLELGSIEYGVKHLGIHLIMVLGHQGCGAVTAAIQHVHEGNHIDSVIKTIEPALKTIPSSLSETDKIELAVKSNIMHGVHLLETSQPTLTQFVQNGQVFVVGAYYNLDTGAVSVLSSPKY